MASRHIVTSQELTQFVALVGIDWADRKHDFAVTATGSGRPAPARHDTRGAR